MIALVPVALQLRILRTSVRKQSGDLGKQNLLLRKHQFGGGACRMTFGLGARTWLTSSPDCPIGLTLSDSSMIMSWNQFANA
jgi:hypothetical protein